MESICKKQDEFIRAYNSIDDPLLQYEFLLQMGGELPYMKDEKKTESNRITGCQTDSWLIPEIKGGRFFMKADSDSLLIRGVLSIYAYLLNGETPTDILQTPLTFMEETSLEAQMSADRFSVLKELKKEIFVFCQKKAVTKPDMG